MSRGNVVRFFKHNEMKFYQNEKKLVHTIAINPMERERSNCAVCRISRLVWAQSSCLTWT